jgi:hypothetical protein
MRNLNTTITAIRFISNLYHPKRPYRLNPTKLDEYALQPAASKPLFVRAMEYFEKLQIDTRKIERSPQYFRPPSTNIDHNRFVIRRGASNERFQAETFCILNEKYEHHSKIYTDVKKKDEKVGQFPQNSIYSAEQSAIINAPLQVTTRMSNHHRLTQHNNSSLRLKTIQEP